MRTTSLLAALLLVAAAFGQHKEKMDLQLRHFLDRQVMDDAYAVMIGEYWDELHNTVFAETK